MINIHDYRDYLSHQYQLIEKKVLEDESVSILKQLDNKQFLYKRINDIFQHTFSHQRELLISTLINQNRSLKAKVSRLLSKLNQDDRPQEEEDGQIQQLERVNYESIELQMDVRSRQSNNSAELARLILTNNQLKGQLLEVESKHNTAVESMRLEISELRLKNEELVRENDSLKHKLKAHEADVKMSQADLMKGLVGLEKSNYETQSENNRLRMREEDLIYEVEAQKTKIQRLEYQIEGLREELADTQDKNSRLQLQYSKLEKQVAYQEQKAQELIVENTSLNATIEKYMAMSDLGKQEENTVLKLNLELQQISKSVESKDQQIKLLKQQVQQLRQDQVTYKSMYEEADKAAARNDQIRRYESQLQLLESRLQQNQKLLQMRIEERTAALRKKHLQKITEMEKRAAQESEEASRAYNLMKQQKDSEINRLNEECNRKIREISDMRTQSNTPVTTRISNLGMSPSREGPDSSQILKKTLQVNQKRIEELKQQLDEQKKAYSKLQLEVQLMPAQHIDQSFALATSSPKNMANKVEVQEKESVIRQLKRKLSEEQSRLQEGQAKLRRVTLNSERMRDRVADLQKSISLLREQKEAMQKNVCHLQQEALQAQIKHKQQIESVVGRFRNQLNQTKHAYHVQLERLQTEYHDFERKSGQFTQQDEVYNSVHQLAEQLAQAQKKYEEKQVQLERMEGLYSESQVQIRHLKSQIEIVQAEKTRLLNKANAEIENSAGMLTLYEERQSAYYSKFQNFKFEVWNAIKQILNNLREQLYKIKKQAESTRLNILKETEHIAVRVHSQMSKLGQKFEAQKASMRQKLEFEGKQELRDQVQELKAELNQKVKQQTLSSMTALAHKQKQLNHIKEALLDTQTKYAQERDALERVKTENSKLSSGLLELKSHLAKAQRRNAQLARQLEEVKDNKVRIQTSMEQEHEKIQRIEKECIKKMEKYQARLSQENEQLFLRYQKQLNKLVGKERVLDRSGEYQSVKPSLFSPKRNELEKLQQEINAQRIKLQSLTQSGYK